MKNPLHIVTDPGTVLLIDKPLNWTSFDVVNKLRYALVKNLRKFKELKPGEKPKLKVGHAGTLDPLATGLLVVCVGKETKNIDQYMATEKEYTGSIYLGATRPSYDCETPITQTFDMSGISVDQIRSTALQFTGDLMQLPPVHSAVKKDGKRLYEHARAGEEVVLEPRPVTINTFEITAIQLPLVSFRVVCSKGTYIRSLAHDFGKALGGGAYLNSLCRTRSGNYKLVDSYTIDEVLDYIHQLPEREE